MGIREFLKTFGGRSRQKERELEAERLWRSGKPSDVFGPRFDFSGCIERIPAKKIKKLALFQKISRLGYSVPDWKYRTLIPVVTLEEFFDGNDNPSAIAPNIDPHPGLKFFERQLKTIRNDPTVQDVLVDIYHIDESDQGEPDWPGAESIYVLTSAGEEKIDSWNETLKANGPVEGWIDGIAPNGAPHVDHDKRVWRIMWD